MPANTPGGDDGEPLDIYQPTPPRFLNERERKLAEYLEVVKKAHRVTSDNVIRVRECCESGVMPPCWIQHIVKVG